MRAPCVVHVLRWAGEHKVTHEMSSLTRWLHAAAGSNAVPLPCPSYPTAPWAIPNAKSLLAGPAGSPPSANWPPLHLSATVNSTHLPRAMMATLSPRMSASSMLWVVSTIARPALEASGEGEGSQGRGSKAQRRYGWMGQGGAQPPRHAAAAYAYPPTLPATHRHPPMMSHTWRREIGSMPVVGSSRYTTCSRGRQGRVVGGGAVHQAPRLQCRCCFYSRAAAPK